MSEGQFAYSGFTLDELRSLASSPQVGTMQAMPQSFRALADRVGEVADLLTHAQADLPNWWKGPAAEQAAATLGRAAAEARDFHGSALAAASAVSRCAQVVAEQQHQMMNVPDVAAPGITDVVQRPATPFEALEAARQDATYQAAHEQAVQVVNGIAAQYVETHDELVLITTMHGENFTGTAIIPDLATEGSAQLPKGSSLAESLTTNNPHFRETKYGASARPFADDAMNKNSRPLKPIKPATTPREAEPRPTVLQTTSSPPRSDTPELTAANPPLIGLRDSQARSETNADSKTPEPISEKDTPLSGEQATPFLEATRFTGNLNAQIGSEAGELSPNQLKRSLDTTTARKKLDAQSLNHITFQNELLEAGGTEHRVRTSIDDPPLTSPQPIYQSQIEGASNDSSATVPPFCGVGSPGRAREERNPRPAYLKERKSAWLPDTVAAPADGVISPDWHWPA